MAKRKPEKELNHDNWHIEDSPEKPGSFQNASADVLKGRVIKQAKRRISNTISESSPKSIFAGFTGFSNQSETKKNHFNSNLTAAKTTDVSSPSKKFSFLSNSASTVNSDLKFDSKLTSVTSGTSQTDLKKTDSLFPSSLPVKSSDFNNDKSNKLKELSAELQKTASPAKSDSDSASPDDIFVQKLRSLNLLCAEWIIKHLNENLSYILTPIFDDYQKYLTKLKDERRRNGSTTKKAKLETTSTSTSTTPSFVEPLKPATKTTSLVNDSSTFKAPDFKASFSKVNSFSSLAPQEPPAYSFLEPTYDGAANFNFHSGSNKDECPKAKGDGGFFKFTAPPNPATTANLEQKPLFSFSAVNGNPFSSNNPLLSKEQRTDEKDDNEEEYEPPPVMPETITEDGAFYEKKCKVYIKKAGSFVDHGIGFLFLKLVGEEKKCQIIVRANNKLATILLNVLFSSNIPVQLMGTNNVMLVCRPTPETDLSSVLLKVKTGQDAEELLNKLNEFKK